MTYDSIYQAVADTYHPPGAWERMLEAGEPEAMNLAEEALFRHADGERADESALLIRDFETGDDERYSFTELAAEAARAANFLEDRLGRGERLGIMLPAVVERYALVFGAIAAQRLFVPLDTKFGPEAVSYRLREAGATTLCTTPDHLDAVDPEAVPGLERVVLVERDAATGVATSTDGGDAGTGTAGDATESAGTGAATDSDATDRDRLVDAGVSTISYDEVRRESATYDPVRLHPSQPYAIGYSSGTTGQPSQQISPHATGVLVEPFLKFVVDLQPTDTYFVAASPAWSYGLTIGTLAAGLRGANVGAFRGAFDLERWVETLDRWEVTNAMVAPTALRRLRAADVDVDRYDVDLRVLVTAGESLDASTSEWVADALGTTPLDAYGLSEGGMVLCNYPFPDWEAKPGSMGKPLPGYEVALVEPDERAAGTPDDPAPDDAVTRLDEPGPVGEIAIRQSGGHGPVAGLRPEGWLRTGDLAVVDEDGYWWYRGRADEVIISAGYRVGPGEVEACLRDHEAVAEAGVIGVPDETRGQRIVAFVAPAPGIDPDARLREALIEYAKTELSKHEYPREVRFHDPLPKTASGKVRRRDLETLYEQREGVSGSRE